MKRHLVSVGITLAVVALATLAGWHLYARYLTVPWTRDAQVRANVVGIAPRVAGPVVEVAMHDNEEVRRGDLLFVIDPADYQARVDMAQAQLLDAQANETQHDQDLARQTDLYRRKVNPVADFQTAQNALANARAQVANAKANLSLAQLNLGYTRIVAPVDGVVTNMNVSPGAYVNAGQRLTALVDGGSYWVAAYFKETQLPSIEVGQQARVTLMGYDGPPLVGTVRSVGWGIYLPDGSSDAAALLPAVNQTVDWVRLPQRFPVRIEVNGSPRMPLRIGQTASVSMVDATDERTRAVASSDR